jgi:hypothetical protein
MYVDPQYTARLRRLVQMMDAFHSELARYPEQVSLVTSYREIVKAARARP